MDEQKIERQVVGGWLDMFAYEVPAEEGANWSRLINTHLAQTAMREPRFVPLATVPLQDGARAAEVLREAHAAGFKGAMIGTQPKGKGGVLDDPSLKPFWETANELGSVVFIHPVFESGDDRVHDYGMANAVGRITDTLIAMSRLIYAGHVTRYANAKIVAGIGGAALPYVIGRLRRNYSLDKDKLGDPDAALAAMYYDTIVQDPRALRYLADIVGADRIMMGSDMPFPIGDLAPLKIVAETRFSDSERAAINGGLARTPVRPVRKLRIGSERGVRERAHESDIWLVLHASGCCSRPGRRGRRRPSRYRSSCSVLRRSARFCRR